MAIGDLFRPKHKHSDAAIRAEAVESLGTDDRELLVEIARSDSDPAVRRLAIDKLSDPEVLAELVAAEPDPAVRDRAKARAVDRFLSSALSGEGDTIAAIEWLGGTDEQRPLAQLACRAPDADHRRRALARLTDPRALADVVRESRDPDLAAGALARIGEVDALRALAMDIDARDLGQQVVDRIDDPEVLAQVGARAKNKHVRNRANKRLSGLRSAESAQVVTPDGWQDAERRQLVTMIETRAGGVEWVESAREVEAAEEVWRRLGPGDDGELARRFQRARQAYWDKQARLGPHMTDGGLSGEAIPERDDAPRLEGEERMSGGEPTSEVEGPVEVKAEAQAQVEAEVKAGSGSEVKAEAGVEAEVEDAGSPAAESASEVKDAGSPAAESASEVEDAGSPAAESASEGSAPPAAARSDQADKPARSDKGERRSKRSPGASDPESNLAALEALSGELERTVTASGLKLKTAEKKLAQADTRYPTLLPLPAAHKRQAMDRFQEARRQLFIKVGELREAEEWKRWASVPKQEELIRKALALVDNPDAGPLPARLKELQEEWKAVGPAPREKAQELWQRFKDASDKVYERIKQHRSHMAAAHKDHLHRKVELCVRAEELAESSDWGPTAEAIKRLQAEWKTVGPVPRKQGDEVWRRFRAACDRFFERRRPILEKTLGQRQDNLEQKQSLVEQVEALAAAEGDDTDWDAAVRQVGDARRDWRKVGPVPQKEFEALGQRFHDACDWVYQRRDEARAQRDLARMAAIEEPCGEAEGLLDAAAAGQELDPAQLATLVVGARAALRELTGGGGAIPDPLRQRIHTLCARAVERAPDAFKGTDLDPEQSKKRKERLLAKIEELAERTAKAATSAPSSPAEMAAALRAALADRALGGVLAKDTVPAAEQVAEMRASWRRLGPVPGAAGEELERRFDDACRRAAGDAAAS